jgi:outer membrane protein assembly factor BamB
MDVRAFVMAVCVLGACGDGIHPLAGDDAGGRDAVVDDAAISDAAVDAAVAIDAPPPTFALGQASYDFGILPANIVSEVDVGIQNLEGKIQRFTVELSGPFQLLSTVCPDTTTCTVHLLPISTSLGPITGTITVTGDSGSITAPLAATLEDRISASATAGGTVTADMPGDACDFHACYPAGTTVTFTAIPDPGAQLIGWSDPSCGMSATCAVAASVTPVSLLARFTAVSSHALEITFIGNAPGQIAIGQGAEFESAITICSGSCTVQVSDGAPIEIVAASPFDIVGLPAPCPQTFQDPEYRCELPSTTASVTADFEMRPGEQALFPSGTVYSVDPIDDGGLLFGTAAGVTRLSSTLAEVWTVPIAGTARMASDGNVFVRAEDGLYKLDSGGHQVWKIPAGAPLVFFPFAGRDLVATHDGGVVVSDDRFASFYDGTGVLLTTVDLAITHVGLAAGDDGTIFVVAGEPMSGFSDGQILAFTSAGVPLPDVAPETDWPCRGNGAIVVRGGVIAVTVAEGMNDGARLFGLDGSVIGGVGESPINTLDGDAPYFEQGVAIDPSGSVLWRHFHGTSSDFQFGGVELVRFTEPSTIVSSLIRPSWQDGDFFFESGLQIFDMAVLTDGRIALAGSYIGFPGGISYPSGIVEILPAAF